MAALPPDLKVDSELDVPTNARATPKTPRRRWLVRILSSVGAAVVCLMVVVVTGALTSRWAFAEIKPDALRVANEFSACSLARDRACVLRLSTWDASTYDKGLKFIAAVERKLGKRGTAALNEKNVRYMRNAGVGEKSLRWRVQLELQVPYERDRAAKEAFLLEDRGQGLKVVRMNWISEALVLN